MDLLPVEIENIIYYYVHNMNYYEIMHELKKIDTIYCDNCEKYRFVIEWFVCPKIFCANFLCDKCRLKNVECYECRFAKEIN